MCSGKSTLELPSSWGSSNYRPSAPFLYEVASHVKNCHFGDYYKVSNKSRYRPSSSVQCSTRPGSASPTDLEEGYERGPLEDGVHVLDGVDVLGRGLGRRSAPGLQLRRVLRVQLLQLGEDLTQHRDDLKQRSTRRYLLKYTILVI